MVELTPLFLADRHDPHAPLFVPSESHWTPGGISLATAELAKLIKAMSFYREVPKHEFAVTWQEKDHFGHIYKDVRDKAEASPSGRRTASGSAPASSRPRTARRRWSGTTPKARW